MAASQFTQRCADTARASTPASQRDSDQFSTDATDRLSANLGQAVADASVASAEAAGTRDI